MHHRVHRRNFLGNLALVYPASQLLAESNLPADEHLAQTIAEAANGLLAVIRPELRRQLEFTFVEMGKPVYYRVHGPTLLIEYENAPPLNPASGTRANHVHSVMSVPGNDFGEDWLRRHHQEHPHT